MKKPIKTNIKFKEYSQGQVMLLPPSLEDLIDLNHPVRVVNRVIDQIEIDPVIDKYKGGGTLGLYTEAGAGGTTGHYASFSV